MPFVFPTLEKGGLLRIREILNQENWQNHVEAVATMENLNSIDFHGNRDFEEIRVILDAVVRNPHVKVVSFFRCEVDSHTLRRICREVQNLEELELESTSFADEEATVRVLQSNVRKLRKFSCLSVDSYRLNGILVEAVATSLRLRSSLKKLSLRGLNENGITALAVLLQQHTSLEDVEISSLDHKISDDVAIAFALAFEQTTSQKRFFLGAGLIPASVMLRLFQALTLNSTLEDVTFMAVEFDEDQHWQLQFRRT